MGELVTNFRSRAIRIDRALEAKVRDCLKAFDPEQEALLVENPATALQDDCKRTMTDNESKKALGFSSAAANVRAYQAKLLEMAQANMQFAFEFAQRLATIRSPVEFPGVIAEFTNRRIAMFQKHSKEMAEFSALR